MLALKPVAALLDKIIHAGSNINAFSDAIPAMLTDIRKL
jgi:hypothetical protein